MSLTDSARELVPLLRQQAPEADKQRRIPGEVHQALLSSGVYGVYVPKRYGGPQCDYRLGAEIAFELGRGCGSAAWVASVLASHAWVQGMMSVRSQDEVWKET